MRERPIIFSGHSVRAIIEGRKTQTRRIVRASHFPRSWRACCRDVGVSTALLEMYFAGRWEERPFPYGRPGDHLWVRETWAPVGCSHDAPGAFWGPDRDLHVADRGPDDQWQAIVYRADTTPAEYEMHRLRDGSLYDGPWNSPIHMPRWASRLILEIDEVRVERLQDITEEDAIAEGAIFTDYGRKCFHEGQTLETCPAPDATHPQRDGWSMEPTTSSDECLGSPRMAFANGWNRINGKRPGCAWADNPWVWVISFNVLLEVRDA